MDNMLYSPNAVATIINLVITSHGGYIETVTAVDASVAFEVMFNILGGESFEGLKTIYYATNVNLITARNAVKAVEAYLGV